MYKKIYDYSLNWRFGQNIGICYLKLEDGSIVNVRPSTVEEMAAIGSILRNEKPTFYHTRSHDITTGWEPTGENE